MEAPAVIVIGGPTASGKSGLALRLAAALDGVVINGDSLQLYDGLPTLTAQPSAEDKTTAPHFLYATLSPDDTCSAARWRDMALDNIGQALEKGKTPVIVGGTGFYLKTLLRGISPIPDVPHTVREEAAALQKKLGNPAFHAALASRDPVMAARLHPFNTQRLIRAWEVLAFTGKSLAVWQELPPVPPPAHLRFVTVALLPPRETLYRNCNARFSQMIENGALAETAIFMQDTDAGKISAAAPLRNALGYAELAAHLRGKKTLEDAVTEAQQVTRHYAKRQTTWFRHQIEADIVLESPNEIAVMSYIKASRV